MSKKQNKIDLVGILSFGFFILLIGILFVFIPGLSASISNFFAELNITAISSNNFTEFPSNIYVPTPTGFYPEFYNALFQFCIIFGFFQIFALILRYLINDYVNRKVGNFTDILFWFGAAYLVYIFLNNQISWIVFLGFLVILLGLKIVLSNSINLIINLRKNREENN
ncbi:MAG: hypothetical protein QME14_07730 [Methanobacteriaceae archaeon]|nr:hypothetical protein [Methanobacteriaceae archaeon]